MAKHRAYLAKSVVGIFEDRSAAEQAIVELLNSGFDRDYISVVMRETGEIEQFVREVEATETKAAKTAAAGAGVGATPGGAAGFLAGLGVLAIPGIGPVLAAGPIAMGIIGALGGGAAGGLTSSFVGLGIGEEEARGFEQYVKAGSILVAVQCGDRCDKATSILKQSGAINFGRQRTMGGTRPGPEIHGKRQAPAGKEETEHGKGMPHVERPTHREEGRHYHKH